MNTTPTTIRLNKAHVKRASRICASAFYNYPQSITMIPDGKKRRRIMSHVFECCLNYGVLYGEVHAISENMEGIAVWLPANDSTLSFSKMVKAGFLNMARKVGPTVLYRLISGLLHSSSILDKHARNTDWTLFQLAVNPFYQGKGHAGALLKSMLKRLDEKRQSCCLDTHDKKNVDIYKRYGFEVVYSGLVPQTGTNLWTMVRKLPA